MYKVALRKTKREKRKLGIRSNLTGTAEKPRLSVFRSNKHIHAQLIDDVKGITLAAAGSDMQDASTKASKTEISFEIGKALAKKAVDLGISVAVFDRNGYRYHGRVKSLADGAREGGLTL